jgi:hypothetical protein
MNTHPEITLAGVKVHYVQQNRDYRRLALIMGCAMVWSWWSFASNQTLRPEDTFAVIDLHVAGGKKRCLVEASWACPTVYPRI